MSEIFSRGILAGYSPEVLKSARVLIVGLGALGQNVLQDLALSGVDKIALVDFDTFEPHNATRSPFYPTADEQRALGLDKAPTVAYRASQATTMPGALITYWNGTIQEAGNGLIVWADVVISAVDSVNARGWLAEQCRLCGTPILEAGFSGPSFTLGMFSGASGEPCYRCASPERVTSASCTVYALEAERAGAIPAIQTTAAVAGGLQAELAIELLHGHDIEFGTRLFGNTRTHQFGTARLQVNPACPGEHDHIAVRASLPVVPATIGELAAALSDLGVDQFAFTEPIVTTPACRDCHRTCNATMLESAWLANPRCAICGGTAPQGDHVGQASYTRLVPTDAVGDLAAVASRAVGINEGARLVCIFDADEVGAVVIGDAARALDSLTPAVRALSFRGERVA